MKLTPLLLGAALLLPSATSAATWSPKDIQKAVYIAGGLAVTGAVIYHNEQVHHSRDTNLRQTTQVIRIEQGTTLGENAVDDARYVPHTLVWTCTALDALRNCVRLELR